MARDLGIEVVAGRPPTAAPRWTASARSCGPQVLGDGDAVLLKGSRVAGLERLVDLLR